MHAEDMSLAPTRLTRTLAVFFLLIAAGLAGNYFPYEIFFSIQFVFGSIFSMLALQFLGLGWGVAAGALISAVTWHLWNHPYSIVIMTLEVLAVGLLVRRKQFGFVLADVLYWLFIGIPLSYFIYSDMLHLGMNTTLIFMFKQALNGIFNVMVARLLFMAVPRDRRLAAARFSYSEVLFTLLTLFVLVPCLLLLIINGRADRIETAQAVRESLSLNSRRVSAQLEGWLREHISRPAYIADLASREPASAMQDLLREEVGSDPDFLRMGLMDRDGRSVAYFPPVDELGQSNIGRDFEDRPYIPVLRKTLRPMLTEIMTGKVGASRPIAAVVVPVVSRGAFAGFVGGVLNLDGMQKIIMQLVKSHSLPDVGFSLIDKNGRVIVSSRREFRTMDRFTLGEGTLTQLEGGVTQWLPPARQNVSLSERWKEGIYTTETVIGPLSEWKLVLEEPTAPFQEKLYRKYAANFARVFALLLSALMLAHVFSKSMTRSLARIADISSNLPEKLSSGGSITWPSSRLTESGRLIANFQDMAQALALEFEKMKNLNAVLDQQVNERTRELKKSEQKYRILAENTSDVVWQLDLRTNRFTYVSPSVIHLRGYTPEEVMAQPVEASLTPASLRDLQGWIEEALREFAAGRTDPHMGVKRVEQPRRDGTTVLTEVSTTYVLDADNRPVSTIGISRDITDRIKAEEALRRSEELIRSILDNVDEGFIVVDRDYRIMSANKAYCRQADVPRESIIGKRCFEVSHKALSPCRDEGDGCAVRGVFQTGEPHMSVHKHQDKSGNILYMETKAFPLRDASGTVTSVIETVRNITERRLLEEEQLKTHKLEAIGTLAGGLAHDFNNLLQGVFGYISAAKMKLDNKAKALAMLEQAEKALTMSVNLTTQLLTFSKGGKPVKRRLNLNPVIANSVRFALSGSRCDSQISADRDLWFVEADEGQIGQVIQNIALNASEAMPAGGTVKVRAGNVEVGRGINHNLPDGGRFVRIEIQDSGPGIPGQHLGRIFDPYFTTKQKGSGLGLATSYSIVGNHGGAIEVSSEQGKGSTFSVYLPSCEAVGPEAEQPRTMPGGRRGRVLVMDDETMILHVAQEMIEVLGHQVESTENGADAVEKFRQAKTAGRPFDVVILDLTVKAGMGGEEAIRILREIDPEVKAIVSSGYSDNAVVSNHKAYGFAAFLNKPYTIEALRDCIDSLLS